MRVLPTHYFSRQDLEPTPVPQAPSVPLLAESTQQDLERIARDIRDRGRYAASRDMLLARQDLALVLAFLRFVGAITISESQEVVQVEPSGPLANDFPYVVSVFLKHGFSVFEDWGRRTKALPDRLIALEFLHHIETRRVEKSRAAGFVPEVIHKAPVAYAIIKARSESLRRDVYLMELNKDWNLYNLIGGKQEVQDDDDYACTLLREIEEKLSVARHRVLATPLCRAPLDSYSLTGGRGTLSHYPCTLFSIRISGHFVKRDKDRWFTEEEIVAMADSTEPRLMISPVYLDFLRHRLQGGLAALPYSLEHSIDDGTWYHKASALIAKHQDWVVPALTIIAALIAVAAAIVNALGLIRQ